MHLEVNNRSCDVQQTTHCVSRSHQVSSFTNTPSKAIHSSGNTPLSDNITTLHNHTGLQSTGFAAARQKSGFQYSVDLNQLQERVLQKKTKILMHSICFWNVNKLSVPGEYPGDFHPVRFERRSGCESERKINQRRSHKKRHVFKALTSFGCRISCSGSRSAAD